jgi:hypothetical protein
MMAVTWIWENLTGVSAAVGILTGLTGLVLSIWTRLDQRGDARRNRIERNKIARAYLSGGGARAKRIKVLPPNQTVLEDVGEFQFHVNNYGKTPGMLYQLGFGFCDEASIPHRPEYTVQYRRSQIDPGRRGEPIAQHKIPTEYTRPVVYGRFYYETIFGTRHSQGFIYRILLEEGSEPIPPPSEDYIRDQDEPLEERRAKGLARYFGRRSPSKDKRAL